MWGTTRSSPTGLLFHYWTDEDREGREGDIRGSERFFSGVCRFSLVAVGYLVELAQYRKAKLESSRVLFSLPLT